MIDPRGQQVSNREFDTVLLLGGAGLVGAQVARQIAFAFSPKRIVVASLLKAEAEDVVERLKLEHPKVEFEVAFGNLFVPTEIAHEVPWKLSEDPKLRQKVLQAVFGPFGEAYEKNHLVKLVRDFRPDVVVDCVNTATGISYQNVSDGVLKVKGRLADDDLRSPGGIQDIETLLMSQSNPQLVRHVLFVYNSTKEAGTRFYVKVGTTGTGGMGLNIPYTHGEDKPSPALMAKNAMGFAHTGMLFVMARTPDAPIVKEIKPAAMIGYKAVRHSVVKRKGQDFQLFQPKSETLAVGEATLRTQEDEKGFEHVSSLETTVVDTGENGVFTRGEFAAITAMGQMEVVTPEEVAQAVVLELRGANSGKDIISALDGAVQGPTYRAGLLRQVALQDLARLEKERSAHSVALGLLGPPELSKLLYEVYLLRHTFGDSKEEVIKCDDEKEMAKRIASFLETSTGKEILGMSTSVGVPILMPDGRTLVRGPRVNIPQPEGNRTSFEIADPAQIDAWARKGWVDLRPANMKIWRERFEKMALTRDQVFNEGTAAVDIKTYLGGETLEIGNVVAWIFNNELEGYRIK